jgi:hypothetical protein
LLFLFPFCFWGYRIHVQQETGFSSTIGAYPNVFSLVPP